MQARKHGGAGVSGLRWPEYSVWNSMKQRCHNPMNPAYSHYGGRGITVCDEWRASFQTFINQVGRRPAPGMQLDRIDNNRGYVPDNVRWVTREMNMQNRSFVSRAEAEALKEENVRLKVKLYEARYGPLTED